MSYDHEGATRSDAVWFDWQRQGFLSELRAYLTSKVDFETKRQEVEATITAIQGLRDLLLGDV